MYGSRLKHDNGENSPSRGSLMYDTYLEYMSRFLERSPLSYGYHESTRV